MNHRVRNEYAFFFRYFPILKHVCRHYLRTGHVYIWAVFDCCTLSIQKCNASVCVLIFIDIFLCVVLDACEMTQYCNGVHLHSFYVFGNPFYMLNLIHEWLESHRSGCYIDKWRKWMAKNIKLIANVSIYISRMSLMFLYIALNTLVIEKVFEWA